MRTLAVWCPDWPVVAAGCADVPAAVFHANRVVACSASARAEGVRRGIRRREAQARCPELEVLPDDPARDARAFEPILAVLDDFTPLVEVLRPGLCVFATKGPSRYFGGDEALAAKIAEAIPQGQTGIADGPFAAVQAARASKVVPIGETPAFLAPMPLSALERPELVSLLTRLGLRTLGEFAALPRTRVLERFGWDGALVHAWATGTDDRVLRPALPRREYRADMSFDPPAEQVEAAAFAARTMADDLSARLAADALACARLRIDAKTETGEAITRLWRDDVGFTAAQMAQRTRWQLDGWLSSKTKPTGPLTRLSLIADEAAPNHGVQHGIWAKGSRSDQDELAAKVLARVQGMVGVDGVLGAAPSGGRGPAEQYRLVAWGEDVDPAQNPKAPWPGRLPEPGPSILHDPPLAAALVDAAGVPIRVDGRGAMSAQPAALRLNGSRQLVSAWAGPWTFDERWWDPQAKRRRALFQIVCEDGTAYLVAIEDGAWHIEGTYA